MNSKSCGASENLIPIRFDHVVLCFFDHFIDKVEVSSGEISFETKPTLDELKCCILTEVQSAVPNLSKVAKEDILPHLRIQIPSKSFPGKYSDVRSDGQVEEGALLRSCLPVRK